MAAQFHSTKINAELVVGGTSFEVVGFRLSFELDKPPLAQVEVAVGVDSTTATMAEIHRSSSKIVGGSYEEAELFIDLDGEMNDSKRWPTGRRSIFRGYVSGVTPANMKDGVAFMVNLVHWVFDLARTHAFSGFFTPTTPSSYFKLTSYQGVANLEAIPTVGGTVPSSSVGSKDLWREIIHPAFLYIATEEDISLAPPEGRSGANEAAAKALNKMSSHLDAGGGLMFRDRAFDQLEPHSLFRFLTEALRTANHGMTMLDKMVTIGQSMLFSMVTTVDKAYMAAVNPALNPGMGGSVTLESNEYTVSIGQGHSTTIPRGLVLVGNIQELALAESDTQVQDSYAGIYQSPVAEGSLDVQYLPQWIEGGVSRKIDQISSTDPVSTDVSSQDNVPEDSLENTGQEIDLGPFCDSLAKTLYYNINFSSRSLLVDSRLRFDISPGTIVSLKSPTPPRIVQGGSPIFGFGDKTGVCQRVDIFANCESGEVGTQVSLTHVRDAEEIARGFAVGENPLYNSAYAGAPLQEDLI